MSICSESRNLNTGEINGRYKREYRNLEQLVVPCEARVPLVVEVVLRVTPALALRVEVALWAVLEGVVPVACGETSETRL